MDKSDKTRKFLIATHGTLAAGVKSSLDIIIGSMEHVFLLQGYIDENTSVETQIKEILAYINDQDELIVFTDILGGSITNQVLQHAQKSNIHIISGFNLPLIIDVMLADTETPIDEMIGTAIDNAKEQMVYVNKLLSGQNKETGND
jgi:fructoselysine and glucoselysine-specific PTS system IIA component